MFYLEEIPTGSYARPAREQAASDLQGSLIAGGCEFCHRAFRNSGLADFDRRTLLNRGFSIFSRTDKASSGETAAGNALRYGGHQQIECDALVVRGYLSEEERDNGGAIKKAIEGVILHMVFELQSETAERSRARV